ncbi:MAG TPA: hypothetical protein H9832_03280 [Candidatus Agathobaculum merdavium]|nr:hypothetical protein [Candidatus Agathobaculum merdavium]
MTFADLKKAAYHGRPIPDGLSETERLQCIDARRIYAGYRSGEIDRTEAEPMLGKVQEYPRLIAVDKRALLRYVFALLCEDAGYGDTVFFRMNTPARTNARGIAQNDAQMDHRPDALLFAPRIQHRMVSAVLRLTQGDSCHL